MLDVLFVTPTDEPGLRHECNGAMLLATKLLHEGFAVNLLRYYEEENYNKDYLSFIDGITKKILEKDPKCVAFYTIWYFYHVTLRIAKTLKQLQPDLIIVLGGPQASAVARETMEAMPYIDCISTGEGENTVIPLFKALLKKQDAELSAIPGLYYRRDGRVVFNDLELPLCDLNTLPYWDDRLYAGAYETLEEDVTSEEYFMPIDAGRGCPFSCTFCCSSRFWRRTYRLKTPERIVNDILFYKEKFGIKSFWFSHDAFTVNRKLVEQVCDRILEKKLDIKWRCSTRIDCVTEELIDKMVASGMTRIEVGIETGSSRMQKIINKKLDLDAAVKKIQYMLKKKMYIEVFFMYGFPEETEEDLRDSLKLLFSLYDVGVQRATMAYCVFNPTTRIAVEHFDELVLEPEIKVLTRDMFGCQEEWPMIESNKAIFTQFYHLNTKVRNEYQYLTFFTYLYEKYPSFMRGLRSVYHGDDLQLYRDFVNKNAGCFAKDMYYATECIKNKTSQIFENILAGQETGCLPQLRGLMQYDFDCQRIIKAKENTSIQEVYDFSIMDVQRKRPIEKYAKARTTVLMENIGGRVQIKILDIQ